MSVKEFTMKENGRINKQWKTIYFIGIVTAILVILGTVLDIMVGTLLGGDLSQVPSTAIERFIQFQSNWMLGLYNLDLLNVTTAILIIPTYLALYGAHRQGDNALIKLALIIFVIGTAVFVANNTALPMLELSKSYFAATTEPQKMLLSAAGETMLAQGAHGSAGAFLGFILSTLATFVMSLGMLKGKVFGRVTSYLGIIGSGLLFLYIILVTFAPGIESIAMLIAAPGGICSLAWMILFTKRLLQLRQSA